MSEPSDRSELISRALEQSADGSWLIDARGYTTLVNPAMARMLGYEPHEMLGRHFFDFMHEEARTFAQANLQRRHEGVSEVHEFELRHRDGSVVPTSMSTWPVLGEDGGVIGAHATVTDLRNSRAQLERSRSALHRFERLAAKTPDCLWRIRIRPDGAECIEYVSPGFEDIWGLSVSELEADPDRWWQAIVDEDRPRAREALALASRAGTEIVSYRVRDGAGDVRWVEHQMSLDMALEDGTRVLDGIARDTTRRRELEARVQDMLRHESLSVMAAGLAHDFNNLLTSILGHAGLLMADPPDDRQDLLHQIEEISNAGERAAALCRQLLAYAGATHRAHVSTCLTTLVRSLGALLDAIVDPPVQLVYELDDDLPKASVDTTQLEQVVANLVRNAVEAFEAGAAGTIWVRTGAREIGDGEALLPGSATALPPGRYVYVEIEDDGSGIDEANVARVFDPFFTTKFTGRGLGLASVLGIVRAHQGGVEIDSVAGRGTRLTVLLPAEAPRATPRARSAPRAAKGRRILVIDDDEMVARVAERLLERLGYEAIYAGDGGAAIDLWSRDEGEWAAVLVDLTMPGLSGAQTIQAMQRHRRVPPVVLMSGYSQAIADLRLGQGLPSYRFLTKPFTASSLSSAVQGAIADAERAAADDD